MKHTHILITYLLLLIGSLCLLTGCRSSRHVAGGIDTTSGFLSSKVELTVPTKDAVLTVDGTMKLQNGERMQLSLLMPILRSEVARMEVTPDEILLVDRMGKRFVRATWSELKQVLPRKASFERLEKLLYAAAKSGGKRSLTGTELGIPSLEKAKVELSNFSTQPFKLMPTTLSSRYKQVPLEDLLGMLMGLTRE